VVLDYGGQKTQQNFVVALDPRLRATQQDLAARLALDLQIHADLDALVKDINQALAARDKLQKAVSVHSATGAQAAALAALNRDIDSVAQMAMKSSEGSLLFETKLRDHLAYLMADIDLSYARPTAAHYAVFHDLDQQAKESEKKLEADVAEAGKVAAGAVQ
jgi:aspartate/methionine/tyrosine aminotransferase